MKRHLLGVAAAVLGTVLISGAGLTTAASAAAPVDTTVTLPLFGAPLSFDITTDVGGAITNVAVTPADANTVATKLRPHKVVFQSADPTDATSTGRIVIKSGHGEQSVSARAGSLAAVSGPGIWSGDVFGTGTATTVNFTIAAKADGTPDITGVTSSDATAVVGATDYSSGDGHEGDSGSSARVTVKFANATGDQKRSLTISVRLHTNQDGDTSAKLSISLGRMKGVALDAATAAGAHTWNGTLCDGSAASISYTVGTDGSVSAVTATPATAVVDTHEGSINVKFSDTESIRISVRMDDSGMVRTNISQHLRCNSGDPITNVTTSIPTPDTGGHNHFGGSGHGDHKGGKNG
ncbi:MAG: hypothetical protein ACXVLX_12430 [Ilumatobacteraceae bacterium]